MGKESLLDKMKSLVYKIVLPIYLWSIGLESLDEYLDLLEEDFKNRL